MKDKTFGTYNISDFRELARRRLPKGVFEFVDRGTEDEVSLRRNRAAFERIKLKPRTLVDVSGRNQGIMLFGHELRMPMAIAPTGSSELMWYETEIALARAAAAAGRLPQTGRPSKLRSTSAIRTPADSSGVMKSRTEPNYSND